MRTSLLLFAILLSACAGGESDPPVLTFADFANPPTSAEVLSDSASTNPPITTTSTTSTTTLIVVDSPIPVAVTTESGMSLLEGRGAPRRLVEQPVETGFDDLAGGFVFQLPGAGTDTAADQRIFWSRASRSDAEPFLDVEEGSLLKLWGAEEIGGEPHMILTITDHADDPDERIERLVTFRFGAGDQVLGEVGGDGYGPITIGYGGGRFLLEQQAGEQSVFEFRNDQGAVLSLASNPQPGCAAEPSCARHPAMHPSGSLVAYIEGFGELVDLVVVDLDLGEEVSRIALPASLGAVTGLDYADETVLVNRIDPAGRERALIVDVESSTVGEFGLTGRLQFLRVAPGFDGVVEILAG